MSQKENIHIILSGVNEKKYIKVLENQDSTNCWEKKISSNINEALEVATREIAEINAK